MSKRSPITTHVLDVSLGSPAKDIRCQLNRLNSQSRWDKISEGVTNQDGRIETLLGGELQIGIYRLDFMTRAYFESRNLASFYPSVSITFEVTATDQHYHVPLLLSPYGYSTYRGS